MESCVLFDAVKEDVRRRFRQNKVALDSLVAEGAVDNDVYGYKVTGKIRVANFAYQKYVFARVTFDNWASYHNYRAEYAESSFDGMTDTFTFTFSGTITRAVDVEFALSCVQFGIQMWDNNEMKNYRFSLDEKAFPSLPLVTVQVEETVSQEETSLTESQREIAEDQSREPHVSQFQAHPLTPTKVDMYDLAPLAAMVDEEINSPREIRGLASEPTIVPVEATRSTDADDEQEEALNRLAEESSVTQQENAVGDSDGYPGRDGIEVLITETGPEVPPSEIEISQKSEADETRDVVDEAPIQPTEFKRDEDTTEDIDKLLGVAGDNAADGSSKEDQRADQLQYAEGQEPPPAQDVQASGTANGMDVELQIITESGSDIKEQTDSNASEQTKEGVRNGDAEQANDQKADDEKVVAPKATEEDSGKGKNEEAKNGMERISEGDSHSDVSDQEKPGSKKRKGGAKRFFLCCGGGKKQPKS